MKERREVSHARYGSNARATYKGQSACDCLLSPLGLSVYLFGTIATKANT